MNRLKCEKISTLIIIGFIFYFSVMILLLCFCPPIARDALIHHLAIPKLWISHGGFYEMPWAEYSYYPMNLDLIYLIPLFWGNDTIPNFIHFGFALGTAAMIYCYLRRKFNTVAGLLGFLIFLSTPVISKLATMAYVDLGLVFFITVSVLSFLRWLEQNDPQCRWLVISAIAMGLALGTKYNAMVAWFFMTLAVVFISSRNTGRSGQALKHGLLFFLISLAVFSPWLIKNAVLTGNPLYPLFPGLFAGASSGGGIGSSTFVHAHASLFRSREIFFGENLLEILSIPIRIFFQGQDDSPKYFDGVLTPLLILFVPFAFIRKEFKAEKLLFLLLASFVILTAFLLDQIRIRYMLTAIPFLAVLSVVGIMNIYEWLGEKVITWRKLGILTITGIVLVLLGMNVNYIQKYFFKINPLPYIMNNETRDQFISRHDASYPAIMFINNNTPEDSIIRLILLAGRGYYLDRLYQEDRSKGMGLSAINEMVKHSDSNETFRKYINSLNVSHFLFRNELFVPFVLEKFDSEKVRQLQRQINLNLRIIYSDGRYVVFEVIK